MDRRDSLRAMLAGAAATAVGPWAPAVGQPKRTPNILIFLSDDHSLADAGCYGNTVVRTPNIDRLAREGRRFDRAFTGTAMCSPSRSMMYTGLYPHRNGCHMNHGKVLPNTRSMAHYLTPLGYRVGLAGKRHIGPAQAFPFEYLKRAGVEGFIAGAAEQPFCLVIASNEPHGPHATGGYDPADIELPPYLIDTPETRRTMAGYYADIDILDREVGETLDLLQKHNLEENTLLIYAGDHGYGVFAKWSLYDVGLNVPFIARWPGQIEAGTVSDAMVHFVDVLPTCIEVGGGEAPDDLDGRSFLPVLQGAADDHHDVIFGAHTTRGIWSGSVYPIRCVRTQTHKYIRNLKPDGTFTDIMTHGRDFDEEHASGLWRSWREKATTDEVAAARVEFHQRRPAEELYDLRTDPYELTNLAGDSAQQDVLTDLRGRLDAWMEQQGDRGLEAELAVPPKGE